MSKKRRTFSNALKFTIVLEAIKGQRQVTEIAAEYNVHPNQITTWKKQFLNSLAASLLYPTTAGSSIVSLRIS